MPRRNALERVHDAAIRHRAAQRHLDTASRHMTRRMEEARAAGYSLREIAGAARLSDVAILKRTTKEG